MKQYITKYSKEKKKFSPYKLKRSLRNAGADIELANVITQKIEKEPSISHTSDIHDFAFDYLKKANRPIAARYNLKRAIADLGPTGFPFEKFVGELLRRKGYSVKIGQIVRGACISHEVDVLAHKEDKHYVIECKFHNRHWAKSHIQTALYIKARFDDIEKYCKIQHNGKNKFHAVWIVTNTKFTGDATRYSNCAGVNLISWSYPKGGSLVNIVEELGVHPVTALTTITKKQKKQLIDRGIVLCRNLENNSNILSQIGFNNNRINTILNEARGICEL